MPPCCASAIARCDSVTVSMAELTIGMFMPMCRVRQVRVSVWAGSTPLRAGCKKYVVESETFWYRFWNHRGVLLLCREQVR